jgi:lipid A 3-O-deacylase
MRAPATTFVLGLALSSPMEAQAGDAVTGEIGTGGDMRLPADASPLRIDAFAVEAGSGDDAIGRGGLALQWDWGVRWLPVGDWYLGGYFELSASYWQGDEDRTGNGSLGEFGLTPVLRFQKASMTYGVRPYLEAGVGAHVMTDDQLGDKDFSTEFAFGSHGGIGIRFGDRARFELGYRYQHLSNLSIGDSNPGINFHLVRLGYHF